MAKELPVLVEEDGIRARLDWRRDAVIAAGLVLTAFLTRGPLWRWWIFVGDEGYLAYGVERILDGEVLYRDFQRNHAPGVYYLFVPLFKLFGPNLLITKALWLCLLPIVSAGMYLVARSAAPRWAAVWAGLQPILISAPPHKTYVPAVILLGLMLCGRLLRKGVSRSGALFAGAGIGVIGFFRQDVAGYTFVIAVLTIAAREVMEVGRDSVCFRKVGLGRMLWAVLVKVAALGAGALAAWVPVLAVFAMRGAIVPMFKALLVDCLRDHAGMQLSFPPLSGIFAGGTPALERVRVSIFYFPIVMVAWGAATVLVAILRRRTRYAHLVLAQWVLMAFFMLALISLRSDLWHVKQVMAAPALVFAYCTGAAAKRAFKRGGAGGVRGGVAIAFIVAAGWGVAIIAYGAWGEVRESYGMMRRGRLLNEPKARVMIPRGQAKSISVVLREVRELTEPGEAIFIAPYASLLYFLADRPNATRYDAVFPGLTASPEAQREIIEDLEEHGVRVIVVEDIAIDGREERRFPCYTPEIARYIDENFEKHMQVATFVIYVRSP